MRHVELDAVVLSDDSDDLEPPSPPSASPPPRLVTDHHHHAHAASSSILQDVSAALLGVSELDPSLEMSLAGAHRVAAQLAVNVDSASALSKTKSHPRGLRRGKSVMRDAHADLEATDSLRRNTQEAEHRRQSDALEMRLAKMRRASGLARTPSGVLQKKDGEALIPARWSPPHTQSHGGFGSDTTGSGSSGDESIVTPGEGFASVWGVSGSSSSPLTSDGEYADEEDHGLRLSPPTPLSRDDEPMDSSSGMSSEAESTDDGSPFAFPSSPMKELRASAVVVTDPPSLPGDRLAVPPAVSTRGAAGGVHPPLTMCVRCAHRRSDARAAAGAPSYAALLRDVHALSAELIEAWVAIEAEKLRPAVCAGCASHRPRPDGRSVAAAPPAAAPAAAAAVPTQQSPPGSPGRDGSSGVGDVAVVETTPHARVRRVVRFRKNLSAHKLQNVIVATAVSRELQRGGAARRKPKQSLIFPGRNAALSEVRHASSTEREARRERFAEAAGRG